MQGIAILSLLILAVVVNAKGHHGKRKGHQDLMRTWQEKCPQKDGVFCFQVEDGNIREVECASTCACDQQRSKDILPQSIQRDVLRCFFDSQGSTDDFSKKIEEIFATIQRHLEELNNHRLEY